MEKFIIANWKANLSYGQAEKWLKEISTQYQPVPGLKVVLAVPFLFLAELHNQFKSLPEVSWAAQDVSSFPLGNYTGSIPAPWLSNIVEYVIVGHQERRKYFRETIQDVANKVSESLEEDIRPIVCVDMDSARQQAASVDFGDLERVIVAYTPTKVEQPEITKIVSAIAERIDKIAALFPGAPVIYGGGVNEGNVGELFDIPQLSGVMVAGGCLDPEAFTRLVRNAGDTISNR